MKKGLTLIETILAVAIFSVISVPLYSLLSSGISVRRKIELQDISALNRYINLDRIAQELRNAVSFLGESSDFKAEENSVEFYSLLFDYPSNTSKLLNINYNFNGGALVKTLKHPITKEVINNVNILENLESVRFYYFNNAQKEWQDKWTNETSLPQGIRMELSYKDNKGNATSLKKYVFLYRQ